MDSPPINSRFFRTSGSISESSESDKEDEVDGKPKSLFDSFCEYVKKPDLSLTSQNSTPPTNRFYSHIEDPFDPIEPISPTELLQKYIDNHSLEELGASSSRREIVGEYIDRVSKAPDTPTRKLRSQRTGDALKIFSKKLSPQSQEAPQYHTDALENFRKFPLASGAMQDLRHVFCKYPYPSGSVCHPIVNMVHITQGEIDGVHLKGYHSCIHEAISVTDIVRNPITQVYCGTCRLDEPQIEKFSTFFPPSLDSEVNILNAIQNAEKIAQRDNCFLYRSNTHIPFYIEKLFQEGRCIIQSAYPIFYFGIFVVAEFFQITENFIISSQGILDCLDQLNIRHEQDQDCPQPIKYRKGDEFIVDIALIVKDETAVKEGIYFRFTRDLLRDKLPFSLNEWEEWEEEQVQKKLEYKRKIQGFPSKCYPVECKSLNKLKSAWEF